MLVANTVLVTGQSMTATFTTNPFRLKYMDRAAIQAVWTGTPVGNFTLQYSSDIGQEDGQSVSGITNYTTVTGSSQAAGGAAGSQMWDITTAAKWVRVVYTASSSTGTCTITVNSKGSQ